MPFDMAKLAMSTVHRFPTRARQRVAVASRLPTLDARARVQREKVEAIETEALDTVE